MSETRRSPWLFGGVALAGAVLLAAVVLLRSPSAPVVSPRSSSDPTAASSAVAYRPVPAYVAPAIERPLKPAETERLAKAMDQSGARQLVRALASAAAGGNTAMRAAMIDALAKHGASPRPVLEEEMSRPQPPAVRQAFEEALARCR